MKKQRKLRILSSDKNVLKREVLTQEMKINNSEKNVLRKANLLGKIKVMKKVNKKKQKDRIILKFKNNNILIENIDEALEKDNKFWAVVAYIFAPLVYIFKIDSVYVLEHARRGMYLFYFEVSYILLYNASKNLIKTSTSCNNFVHYNFIDGCKATPWWIEFIWGVVALLLVGIVVKCIKSVLCDDVFSQKEIEFN